jgi:hypothetical protein
MADDQPIKAGIGGQYLMGFGAFLQQDDNPGQAASKRAPDGVSEEVLIKIYGSTTFDNGITAGVYTRLRGLNRNDSPSDLCTTTGDASPYTTKCTTYLGANNSTVKDSYAYLKSPAWGEFRIGDDSDVRRTISVGNQGAVCGCGDVFLNANSPAVALNNSPIATSGTTYNLDGRASKVEFWSPVFSGFQIAASFAPDKSGGHTGTFGDLNGDPASATASYENQSTIYNSWSVGSTWAGTFGSTKLQVSAAATGASAKGVYKVADGVLTFVAPVAGVNDASPLIMNAGVAVTNGPFALGIDFEQGNHVNAFTASSNAGFIPTTYTTAYGGSGLSTNTNHVIDDVFDANLSYTVGPIRTGVEWQRGYYDGLSGAAPKTGAIAQVSLDLTKRPVIQDTVIVGAQWTVGPGVTLLGEIEGVNYDPNGPVPKAYLNGVYSQSYTSVALLGGLGIRF